MAGEDITDVPPWKRNVGMVFQTADLPATLQSQQVLDEPLVVALPPGILAFVMDLTRGSKTVIVEPIMVKEPGGRWRWAGGFARIEKVHIVKKLWSPGVMA